MVSLGMTVAKKVTSHILTAKSKMLRKKSKYDPKYSGKPTLVGNVAGNLNTRLRKQLPSLSGVVILLLIGYIAYEQMSKKSRTSMLHSEEAAEVAQDRGKLIQDAPMEILQDLHPIGRVDQFNNLAQQNPKIKGVNDMKAQKQVMPVVPNGQNVQIGNVGEEKIFGERVRSDYNQRQDNLQAHQLPLGQQSNHGQVIEPQKPINQKPLAPNQPDFPVDMQPDINLHSDGDEINGDNREGGYQKPDQDGIQNIEVAGKVVQSNNGHHFVPLDQKPKVNYPQPKWVPVAIVNAPKLECTEPLTLLLLVHTEAFHFGTRRAIRDTWGVQTKAKFERFGDKQHWKTIFIIGKAGFEQAEKEIAKEAEQYHDILRGDFLDSEYENTRKFITAMSWVNSNIGSCKPKFVLKTQDNVFHNMFSIINWLGKKFTSTTMRNIYMGRLLRENSPIRDSTNPLYVSYADYQQDRFPAMIEGPLYLFDYTSYKLISEHTFQVTPIAMEDGYIAQIAAKIGLKPTHNDHFMLLKLTGNHCHNLRLFFLYDIQPSQHQKIFTENKEARNSVKCRNAQAVEQDGRRVDIEM